MVANGEKLTRWHRLAKLLEKTLGPVGISVSADLPVMSNPPEADILLLRNEGREWTREQKKRLPDGIRNCRASHVLVEFKCTESLGRKAFSQAISYDHFYRQTKDLPDGEIRTFLVSSKTPAKKTLALFGFGKEVFPGVFRSDSVMLKDIPLILLNELSDEPHNAFFKVFGSRKREKRISFDSLMKNRVVSESPEIMWLIGGLATYWLYKGEDIVKNELTPEKARELGRRFQNTLMSSITLDEWFEKYGRDRLVAKLGPEDLAALKTKDRLAGISVEELETYLRELKKKKK